MVNREMQTYWSPSILYITYPNGVTGCAVAFTSYLRPTLTHVVLRFTYHPLLPPVDFKWKEIKCINLLKAVFVQLYTCFVLLCLFCTEIHGCVLCCQSRQFQICHTFWVISGDFNLPFKGFGVIMACTIRMNTSHPDEWFSSLLSDPVHAAAVKAESRSTTGESQSISRPFLNCTFYWLHTLTFYTWKYYFRTFRTKRFLFYLEYNYLERIKRCFMIKLTG